MYVAIENKNPHPIRVKITEKKTILVNEKSFVGVGISPKSYKQLRQDPKLRLSRFPPYEYFRKVLKQNAALRKRIATLEKELAELSE